MSLGLSRIGWDSLVYFAGGFLGKGAKFLLIPVYVRFLTPAEVGIVIWLEAVSVALGRLLSFGLGQSVKRFYVEFEEERQGDVFAATIFWLSSALAVGGGGILAWAALRWGGGLVEGMEAGHLALAIVIGVLQSNYSIPMQRFIARREPFKHGLFELLQFFLAAALIIYLVVVEGMGVYGVLLGGVASAFAWNIVAAWAVTSGIGFALKLDRVGEAVRYSLPTLPHLMFTWGITFVDRPILERFVSLASLGVYGIGYQVASVLPMLTNSMLNAWIARFFLSADDEGGPQRYAETLTYCMLVLVMAASGVALFAPEIIALVATPEYSGAVVVTRVVALGLVFHGSYQALLLVLFYTKATPSISVATGSALIANIGLNLLLVPRVGILGAALSTVAAYGVATLVTYRTALGAFDLRLEWRRLAHLTSYFGLLVVIMWNVPLSLGVMGSLLKAVGYLGVTAGLFVSGFLSDEERHRVRRRIREAF